MIRRLGVDWVVVFVGILVAGVAVVALASQFPGNIDDAFIVLVYARHLTEGGGIFWNQADGPVEGYTSPLDLVVKSVGTTAWPDDPLAAAFWSTVGLHAACAVMMIIVVLTVHTPRRGGVRALAVLAALTVGTNSALAFGSSFLLETPLLVFATLLVLALVFTASIPLAPAPTIALSAALLALMLARPEGGPLALLVGGYVIATQPKGPARNGAWIAVCGVLLLYSAFLVWRRLYFGDWLPNTYQAKASDNLSNEIADGWRYLWAAAATFRGALLLAVGIAGWLAVLAPWWNSAQVRRRYLLLSFMGLAAISTVLLGGGDSYAGERFVALPMVIVISMIGSAAVGLDGRARWVPFGLLVVLLIAQASELADRRDIIREQLARWPITEADFDCEARALRRLAAIARDLPIAQSDCQRLKYFADEATVIDLSGLSDRGLAHRPAPGPIVWGRYGHDLGLEVDAPVWIWGYHWMSPSPLPRIPIARLVRNQRLTRRFAGYQDTVSSETARQMVKRYAPASIKACGSYLNFLVRRDYAAGFRRAGIPVGK